MTALLEVKDLQVGFPGPQGLVRVIDGLDYRLEHGETLAVVGESGSGKSLQALAIVGLLGTLGAQWLGGSVRLDGRELSGLSPREWAQVRGRQIGFVFQDPLTALNPLLTVGRQLAMPLQRHLGLRGKALRQRCRELFDQVGIDQAERRLRQFPWQLSGGQRQRVLIAMAIACGPRLLIADEATTALDVTVQAQIIDLFEQLKRELSLGLIWITHDLGVVARLADSVQVMYAGRIVERAPVDALFHDPRNAYTLGLLRSLPGFSGGRLQAIPGQPPLPGQAGPGDAFAARNRYRTPRCLLERPPLRQVEEGVPGHLCASWYDLRAALAAERVSA
ncbi:MAG: Oligopeptide transport ATP-binding protein OppD [Stenotrophomonas maltophilia]|nr:MAG: Oligopeptide transport ATP-binding protein OppD [Stenotrophomonas maltophilia]